MEVKYMKLVEGAQGKDGELPAAQTCAWSDEDEEEELNNRVAFKSKGDKLFGKLGNSSKVGFSLYTFGQQLWENDIRPCWFIFHKII